jgi:hypothetical protein
MVRRRDHLGARRPRGRHNGLTQAGRQFAPGTAALSHCSAPARPALTSAAAIVPMSAHGSVLRPAKRVRLRGARAPALAASPGLVVAVRCRAGFGSAGGGWAAAGAHWPGVAG